jgi:hypothetical protein
VLLLLLLLWNCSVLQCNRDLGVIIADAHSPAHLLLLLLLLLLL